MSPFTWPARVYWEDTDGGGIVYYANYLRFLERARTEWLRSLGHSQRELAHEPGILFAVVSLNIDYRRPARLDDELIITCEPRAEGAASLRFEQRILRAERAPRAAAVRDSAAVQADPGGIAPVLVEASVRVACLDAKTLRPRKLPDFLVSSVSGGSSFNG